MAAPTNLNLVHKDTGYIAATVKDGSVEICSAMLNSYFDINGIEVPALLQNVYGVAHVYPSDKEFKAAFTNIYVPQQMLNKGYEWRPGA